MRFRLCSVDQDCFHFKILRFQWITVAYQKRLRDFKTFFNGVKTTLHFIESFCVVVLLSFSSSSPNREKLPSINDEDSRSSVGVNTLSGSIDHLICHICGGSNNFFAWQRCGRCEFSSIRGHSGRPRLHQTQKPAAEAQAGAGAPAAAAAAGRYSTRARV